NKRYVISSLAKHHASRIEQSMRPVSVPYSNTKPQKYSALVRALFKIPNSGKTMSTLRFIITQRRNEYG
ncbi:hypothetical protein K6U21_14650, partial [Vibrio vulnificus]|uniref:hypothetical protein n=1 Tax=Vibrio vulnificus TaxID=672 RepID=UPI001EEA6DF9